MHSSLLFSTLLAAAGTTLAQTPPNFTPSTDVNMPATFDVNNTSPAFFLPGGVFNRNATQEPPQLFLPINFTTPTSPNDTNTTPNDTTINDTTTEPPTYILLMLDPDAPSPTNTTLSSVLHWLQPGIRLSRSTVPLTTNNSSPPLSLLTAANTRTPALVPYTGPAPPSTAPHRYIILLFPQPAAAFELPGNFSQYAGGAERLHFDLPAFVEAAGLAEPVAATWFLAGLETVGDGSELYEGDDAAEGAANGTASASGSASASASGAEETGGAAATGTGAMAAPSSGAGRVGVGAVMGAVMAGAVAVLA